MHLWSSDSSTIVLIFASHPVVLHESLPSDPQIDVARGCEYCRDRSGHQTMHCGRKIGLARPWNAISTLIAQTLVDNARAEGDKLRPAFHSFRGHLHSSRVRKDNTNSRDVPCVFLVIRQLIDPFSRSLGNLQIVPRTAFQRDRYEYSCTYCYLIGLGGTRRGILYDPLGFPSECGFLSEWHNSLAIPLTSVDVKVSTSGHLPHPN